MKSVRERAIARVTQSFFFLPALLLHLFALDKSVDHAKSLRDMYWLHNHSKKLKTQQFFNFWHAFEFHGFGCVKLK